MLDGLRGALLVGADDAGGPALDPACGVHPGQGLVRFRVHDPAFLVGEDAARLVERQIGDGTPPVADRPQAGGRGQGLGLPGAVRLEAADGVGQFGAFEGDRVDPAVPVQRDGCGEEAQHDPLVVLGRGPAGEALDLFDLQCDPWFDGGVVDEGPAGRVEFGVGRVDDDVDAPELTEGQQFRIGVGGLGGSAPSHDDDLADVRRAQGGDGVIGHVGLRQLVRVGDQCPRDVEGDVAVADDHRAFAGQVEGAVGVVGVPVVPGDELGGGVRAGQVLAGHVQVPVGGGTDGVDHGVVVREQFLVADVGAHLDVEPALALLVAEGAAEQLTDGLGALVVRGDTGADESVRGGQTVEDVDLDAGPAGQLQRGVAGGRARTDDRDPQGAEFGGDLGAVALLGPVRSDRVAPVVVLGDLQVRLVLGGKLVVGVDRVHRAFVHARAAVDAGVRVDVEHLGGGERRLVGRGVNAVDGADLDARGIVATRLGDHVNHGGYLPEVPGVRRPPQTITCSNSGRDPVRCTCSPGVSPAPGVSRRSARYGSRSSRSPGGARRPRRRCGP